MSEKSPCIFCNYPEQYIIENTEYSIATHSPEAIKPGHIVVAVREHVTAFSALTDAQAADVFTLARRVAARAKLIVQAEKYYIAAIADLVPHFHLHLLPRMSGDAPIGPHVMGGSGWEADVSMPVTEQEAQALVSEMRKGGQ